MNFFYELKKLHYPSQKDEILLLNVVWIAVNGRAVQSSNYLKL